jgi:cell wall-associated NlpC family hydrolase
MMKMSILKTTVCATALLVSLGYSNKALAETTNVINLSDMGLAGISTTLDTYYDVAPEQETGPIDEYMEGLNNKDDSESEEEVTKVVSPYANLGISIANDYVNIRKEPNTESEVVGKLYEGCATDILEDKGEWVKIKSGNVEGYINKTYLAIGVEAEALIDKYATKYATVINTETLRVRDKKSTDAITTTLIPEGETYFVLKEFKDWVKIQIDDGNGEEGGDTGFVSKDYIKISVKFEYAISIEEEQKKLAAEEAAKKAEADRLEQLAIEQEAERKEEQAKNDTSNNTPKDTGSSDNGSSDSGSSNESHGSGSGQAIADYAVNFVGNPYVWGGESLTNGADCSGFVKSIYSHFGYSISRTSSSQSSSAGYSVDISDRQPGDLIFYTNSSGNVNHVALYIGNNKVVHASNQREGIKISTYNYRTPYKVRRIL